MYAGRTEPTYPIGGSGLTRGELITLRRVFLFVEGAVDKLVFQELFGDRLRDAGVEVMAMHGTSKMQAIIESDLLFESYRQPIAVIVDNIVQDELPPATTSLSLNGSAEGAASRTRSSARLRSSSRTPITPAAGLS